ncbi:MAG: glycosyltransferase family 2 protein [Chloroflexota bacterium]|nr:MAG: glycosyltransferase family 2 protein [Chloroflexota bacterium]
MATTVKPSLNTPIRKTIDEVRIDHDQDNCLHGQSSYPDLVVVIPAYNEERFIGSVVLQSRKFTDKVIVIDDGSQDETAQIARIAGATVICHEHNCGKGVALNSGFNAARLLEPGVVVCIDGDGQHLPEEIELLIEPIFSRKADIVVGSRYISTKTCTPRHRVWGHRLFNFLTGFASGVGTSDSQSGFRAFSPRALRAISFRSKDFSVESEMQFLAKEHRLKVMEVPITIQYPDPPKRSVLVHGIRVLNGLLRLVGQHRPLFYFGVPGAVGMVFGILLGLRAVEIFSRTSQLAVGSALLSILLSMTGMIMVSTGFILHSIRGLLREMLKSRRSP